MTASERRKEILEVLSLRRQICVRRLQRTYEYNNLRQCNFYRLCRVQGLRRTYERNYR